MSRNRAIEPSRRYERVRYKVEAKTRGRKLLDGHMQLGGPWMTMMALVTEQIQHPREVDDTCISLGVGGELAEQVR